MSVDIHKWMGSDPNKLKKQQGVRLRNFGHQQLCQNSAILSSKQPNDDHADAPTADYLAIIIASVMSLWRNSETQAPCTNQNSASLAIRNFVGGDNWRMKIASLITTGTTQPNIRMRQGTRSEVQVFCSPPPRPTSHIHTTANLPSTSEGRLHELEIRDFGFGKTLSINKDANYNKASDFVGQLRQNCRNHLGRGECNTVVTSSNRMRNDTNLSVRVTTSQGEVCYQNLQRDIFPVLFLVNQLHATSELYRQIQVLTNFISCLVTVRQLLLGVVLVKFENLSKSEQNKNNCQTSFNSEKTYNKLNCEKLSALSNSLSFDSGNMAFRGDEFEGGDEMQEGNMGGDGGVDLPHVVPDYGNFVDRDEDDQEDDEFDEELEDGRGANGGAALRGRFAEIDDHRVPQNGHGTSQRDGQDQAQLHDGFANESICNFDEVLFYVRQINEPQLPPPDQPDFLMEVDMQEWADLELLAGPEDFDAANAA